ncbi:MAG: FecR domain-containing protein [Phycisphaerales bacterium]|jgi:hypothetical protein|nr:FecR domain-containing protein [Phycisphaerales bacterium]
MTHRPLVTPLCILALAATAAAQDNAPIETATPQATLQPDAPSARQSIQQRLAALKAIALEAAKELPEGETRVLRAVVMEVEGKVQWRPNAEADWTAAAKDHVLQPGAMIRTGLRSFMMLRVGINATILVDSGSRVTLPQMVHAGDTLRTTVQVQRGRTDVQVGKVGLTNDFSVLTPAGALAVRGTGMAVSHNALQGTQIFGSRSNAMNAIAMRYYGSKIAHMMSGEAMSTERSPDPAAAQAFESAGPAPLQATESQDREDAPDQTTQAVSSGDPINQSVRVLLADQQQAINDEILEEEFGDPFLQDGFSWYFGPNGVVLPEDRGAVATGLYWDMKLQYVPSSVDPYDSGGHRIASVFEGALFHDTRHQDAEGLWHNGWFDSSRAQYIEDLGEGENAGPFLVIPFGTELANGDSVLPEMYGAILNYGDEQWSGQPFTGSEDLRAMLSIVNEFCVTTFNENGEKIEVCREAFANAMNYVIYNDYYGQPGLTAYGQGLQHPQNAQGNLALPPDDCPWCP